MNTSTTHTGNGQQVQQTPVNTSQLEFEHQYTSLRRMENRIYSDKELAKLPEISASHPHYKEWMLREKSSQRLFSYLQGKRRELRILEVGCGNGWLSNKLTLTGNCHVTGIDINRVELDQAARVFGFNADCNFLYADIDSEILKDKKFDVIVFAASIQYFPSVKEVLKTALQLLTPNGEIHILDTHLYKVNKLEAARQRSAEYFISRGFPAMSSAYFHHSIEELNQFHPAVLFNPFSFKTRIFRTDSPFYWIRIKNGNY